MGLFVSGSYLDTIVSDLVDYPGGLNNTIGARYYITGYNIGAVLNIYYR